MSKSKNLEYKITSTYKPASVMYARRYLSDALSQVIDSQKTVNTSIFYEVYQYAMNLTNGNCFWCDTKLVAHDGSQKLEQITGASHWDHFIPAAQWGLFVQGNVVLSCVACNLDKSDSDPLEYWEYRRSLKLPLRYKTVAAFQAVYRKLMNEAHKNNSIGFDQDLSNEPKDILRAFDFMAKSLDVEHFMENYSNGSLARWLHNDRDDAVIWHELNNLDSYVYVNYGEHDRIGMAKLSARDVRNRISRATEFYDETIKETPLTSLTDDEFRLYANGLVSNVKCGGSSIQEAAKFRRLVRVLVEHEELNHFHEIAWSL